MLDLLESLAVLAISQDESVFVNTSDQWVDFFVKAWEGEWISEKALELGCGGLHGPVLQRRLGVDSS